ncbi:armadillo repeat-containing protein 6 [Callorhinchus milii]|uniref:Armadillo repeat containing 6 n=1 Tax=Callorhinchus milii TaxID=7868 RepID=A0A4W3H3J4_CALMI|nr:armadillo repeat-containing protein 6 [Callorhinchus milii]|eukprot:gi/632961890/ref/XP_007897009.1/ PREDICTED: armadillo repeat-containing protein 6 [Callorhinchus milii]
MAGKRITQETFDDVVQENISEFDMEPEEALNDAIQQFESQGVDLNNIIRAVPGTGGETGGQHEVLQALHSVQQALERSSLDEMAECLDTFGKLCRRDFASRHLAAEKSAYGTVLGSCTRLLGDKPRLLIGLQALGTLLDGQPDLLDPEGQRLLVEVLTRNSSDANLCIAATRAVRHACLKHEQNRQDMVRLGVLRLLTSAIANHVHEADLVKEASGALRVMTFDDDIRVPFGRAHDHARLIVTENDGLKIIIEAAKGFTGNLSVLSELCATLGRLAVRNEFCQDVVDLGGLNFLVALLADCINHRELVRQVLGVLRNIAGNDEVKDAIVSAGGTDLIVLAMNQHLGSPQVCEQGCAALAMFALRKPENAKVIMEGGGALVALQAMKAHAGDVSVQKQVCGLMRNMVVRNPHFCQLILELGAESLISQALSTHEDCGDLAKAALRDLGCKVELRELWTGKKGDLAR